MSLQLCQICSEIVKPYRGKYFPKDLSGKTVKYREIKEAFEKGASVIDLAVSFNMSRQRIYQIVKSQV